VIDSYGQGLRFRKGESGRRLRVKYRRVVRRSVRVSDQRGWRVRLRLTVPAQTDRIVRAPTTGGDQGAMMATMRIVVPETGSGDPEKDRPASSEHQRDSVEFRSSHRSVRSLPILRHVAFEPLGRRSYNQARCGAGVPPTPHLAFLPREGDPNASR